MTRMEERSQTSEGGPGYTVGWFWWDLVTDKWTWSNGVYEIHALDPSGAQPTLTLLLNHKHPDDVERIKAILAKARADGQPYSYRHRLIDAGGIEHTIITAGEGDIDDNGQVVALFGSLVDVTQTVAEQAQERALEVFESIVEHRTAIEQAKGCLMAAYGMTGDEAFALMRWHSQHSNIKLAELSARMVAFVSDPGRAEQTVRRKITDALTSITGLSALSPAQR